MKRDDFDLDNTDLITSITALIIMTLVFIIMTSILIPTVINLHEEIEYVENLTPEEYEQYVKQNRQSMYEEQMQVYVDTETGIEYLIYKDSGVFGNDVMVVRYDENGNVKTNSTYLIE